MPAARGAGLGLRVDPEFRGGQFEDEPAVVDVNVRQAEYVAEERTGPLGVLGVDDRMRAGNDGGLLRRIVASARRCYGRPGRLPADGRSSCSSGGRGARQQFSR
jgi:hypothetical protein